ncbi:LysM peptidoglycan-binding domain-containing protein [Colwellia sp. D2M02]|uniref:LysM peptidoglycan-binding domain-containing protein n=1 Tax=Colwellia asteriadis TaxID=517723 RepID=A0ABN1L732_9GAMM|nr:LysM peptidoglycan-binding domain-containing protein [Colwellia sp. D2M02]MBU2892307.1 LysM peptidoglycan-binding domain-containing protein [Colwellia sp. D2M02]
MYQGNLAQCAAYAVFLLTLYQFSRRNLLLTEDFLMKKILSLSFILLLTACQQTPNTTANTETTNQAQAVNAALTKPHVEPEVNIPESIKRPEDYADVWQRIRSQLTIEVPDNEAVAKWREYYLSHPNFMVTISQRAEPFLYYIVEEIEKRNMPLELALLPIVESAYLPYGVSSMSAAGLWQFMPVSAKRFNIEQNWWYDGRRDIVESTRGALDYFEFFHDTFDEDWLNAVAAFNSGEGRVGRAIRKNERANLATDFWSLNLPEETTHFVPKLLAIADILKNAEALNYSFTPIENKPALAIFELEEQLDLSLAAEWANVELAEIYQLNPGLNRWATAPDSNYQLLLPVAATNTFKENLSRTDKKDWLRWQRYQVKAGDSLGKIGALHNIDVAALKKLNDLSSDMIRIGQELAVPVTDYKAYPLALAKLNGSQVTHKVKRGDTLWDISRKYKVKVHDIVRWNNLPSDGFLKLEQKLKIIL